MTTWERLESMGRSVDLDGGLEARIADPLWMLARQWQVGEFRGDDSAQPAAVRVIGQSLPLTGLTGNSGISQPLTDDLPLEALVETAPAPDFGAAGLSATLRACRRLMRLLIAAGLSQAVDVLRAAFPLRLPERMVGLGTAGGQAAALFTRRGFDARTLVTASQSQIQGILAAALTVSEISQAENILAEWSSWYQQRDGEIRNVAWQEERLEYAFSVSAGQDKVELRAPDHTGGHLDWYSFDLASASGNSDGFAHVHTALPKLVRYTGMPAGRWWQFEDGAVNFGDLEVGPTDLARLLVAEFATIYSRDWFVVPISVPVGSLSQITNLEVIDNFGGRSLIRSTAMNDTQGGISNRAWRMYELTGDEVSSDHPAPWLFTAPSVAGEVNGPVLERVLLARDEGANLAWAVESQVEGVLGRAVDRAQAWYAVQPAQGQPRAEPTTPPQTYANQAWRYQIESPTPPWWIPFLPERVAAGSAEIRFRRARKQAWEHYAVPLAGQAGPQGFFLDPRRPLWLFEEEVPAGGICLERRWQFCRWHDGSYHVWLQRRKFPGRGKGSSGLHWDALVPESGSVKGSAANLNERARRVVLSERSPIL
jgi:hypothetical protein